MTRPNLYPIMRGAAPAPAVGVVPKTKERLTMEALGIGDAFIVSTAVAQERCRNVRKELPDKKFTVRKMPDGSGWQVRRTD